MTLTVDQFVARLNSAASNIDRYTEPILTEFGNIVAAKVSEEAPKRTRSRSGSQMTQTEPGVLELRGHLVGEVRGTSQRSPKSRTFLADAMEGIERPLANAVAKAALAAIASDLGFASVTFRRR